MTGALAGIRVIDFGQYIAGPFAAMLLSDQGADVIRVDPPSGPRMDTPANAYWNRGKRSIVLDLAQETDRETARRLVASADVVIENFRPGVMEGYGLGAEEALAANPHLVYCSVPGFAADDARAGTRAWEGVIGAATGTYNSRLTADSDRPVFTAIPISSTYAAFIAATSVAMALNARARDGRGQRIEVPLYDATFASMGYRGVKVHNATAPDMPRGVMMGWTTELQCKDGRWVQFHAGNKSFPGFLEAVGAAGWAQGPDAQKMIRELFLTRTAQEWEDFAEAVGTECAVCRTSEEWLHNEHARASKTVIEVSDPKYGRMIQPGVQVRMSKTPGAVRGPAPKLDAHREAILKELEQARSNGAAPAGDALRAALEGVKVLDLCIVLAGPTCGRTLAEFGADVIKIDRADRPGGGGMASFHVDVNRGKRSILLDLKKPEGLELFWKLAADADVIVENYRKGVVDRLGIGYEDARKRRPDVIYASLNTYGHDGPWADRPGHEQIAQAAAGMQSRYGGDGQPLLQPFAVNDYGTGIMGAYAVALALLHRRATGEGQHVVSALAYTATALQSPYMHWYEGKVWDEPAGQDALGFGPLRRLYRGSDDWFYVGALESDMPAMASIAGLEGIGGQSGEALEKTLESRFAQQNASHWVSELSARGIGAHVTRTVNDILAGDDVREKGILLTREHPGLGLVDSLGPVARLSGTPAVAGRPTPQPGGDTEAILSEIGAADRLRELLDSKVVATAG